MRIPILLRISGTSGSGKTPLFRAARKKGCSCPRSILYTSRASRRGETHAQDYYFLSRSAINALPDKDFFKGLVRTMVQAVDLQQMIADLESHDVVIVEIFHNLWTPLVKRLREHFGDRLCTRSMFVCAVDLDAIRSLPDDTSRAEYIRNEVTRILTWRGTDDLVDIPGRAESAVREILTAIRPNHEYDHIIQSAPEGPVGEDDWTRAELPVGRADQALTTFLEIINTIKYQDLSGAATPTP